MSKKIFLGLILISILLFSVLTISSCIDPKDNPLAPTYNTFPRIGNIHLEPSSISSYATCTISVEVADNDGDNITVSFREEQSRGSFQILSSTMAIWTAPLTVGDYNIIVKAIDESDAFVSGSRTVAVTNSPPVVESVTASPSYMNMGSAAQTTSLITIVVNDVDLPDPSVAITCDLANPETITGTVSQVSTISANTYTTAVYLFTINMVPGFYDCFFDITATDNIGNVTANSPVFKIQTGDL